MDGSSPLPPETPEPLADPAPSTVAPAREQHVSDHPLGPALRRGFAKRCPRCGEGRLFEGYLKVRRLCPSCGEELHHHRADDGPAYLTILVVGHLLAVVMHFAWVQFRPDPLLFATLLTVFAVGLSLWLLPRLKGAVVGFQWSRRMHGFGRGEAASD